MLGQVSGGRQGSSPLSVELHPQWRGTHHQ